MTTTTTPSATHPAVVFLSQRSDLGAAHDADHAGIEEHLEVIAHRSLGFSQGLGQVSRRGGPFEEKSQYRDSGLITQCLELIGPIRRYVVLDVAIEDMLVSGFRTRARRWTLGRHSPN